MVKNGGVVGSEVESGEMGEVRVVGVDENVAEKTMYVVDHSSEVVWKVVTIFSGEDGLIPDTGVYVGSDAVDVLARCHLTHLAPFIQPCVLDVIRSVHGRAEDGLAVVAQTTTQQVDVLK